VTNNQRMRKWITRHGRDQQNARRLSSKYPQNVTDMSANWKRLSQELNEKKSSHNRVVRRRPRVWPLMRSKGNEWQTSGRNKIWFDGVDKCLIKSSMADTNPTNSEPNDERLVKQKSFKGLTKIVGIDCEMVGTGSDGSHSVLARVSIVNFFGHVFTINTFEPMEEITDYRTPFSGIRPSDLVMPWTSRPLKTEVHQILKDRTVVGHALHNDFKALLLSHPKHRTRDTSRYFKKLFGGRKPGSQAALGVCFGA